jgi:hypothetical protein
VAERVELRFNLLHSWSKNGIPLEYIARLPRSLRGVADWDDESIGMLPIRSPNDFTTTHKMWGERVAEIDRLLKSLRLRTTKPQKKKSSRETQLEHQRKIKLLEMSLQTVTSQWHTARAQAQDAKSKVAYQLAVSADLREQLAEANRVISNLRKSLRALQAVPRLHQDERPT